jgi:hypothetical protein
MSDEHRITEWLEAHCVASDVVALNAARLDHGRETYGPFAIDTDPRDFMREAGEEAVDALAYLAARSIQLERAGVTDARAYPSAGLLAELSALAAYAAPHARD